MITRWYGFDTFTGLPEAWRSYPAGAFNADGNPPDIDDPRVEWVIGRVEDTVDTGRLQLAKHNGNDGCQALYLFDLDLYTPTRQIVSRIIPHLNPGDILYFDEAADLDERRVLLEEMERLVRPSSIIGSTPLALALRRRW